MQIEEVTPVTGSIDDIHPTGENHEEVPAAEAESQATEEAAEGSTAETVSGTDDAGEAVTVTIGDEKPPEDEEHKAAPEWVKDLRRNYREAQRRIRELETATQKPQIDALGAKPTLADADFDEQKFETALAAWYQRKLKHDEREAQIAASQQAEQTAWQGKLASYAEHKTALKVPDYDDVEATVQESLNERQQAIIVKAAKNPALVVYALGKNMGRLKEMAKMGDLVEFAAEIGRLEAQLKVTKKAVQTKPEGKVSGTGPTSGVNDSTLERLRAEAEKTGIYTKVIEYKRQKKVA